MAALIFFRCWPSGLANFFSVIGMTKLLFSFDSLKESFPVVLSS